MRKIILASKNPIKIKATLKAFKRMFTNESFRVEGISVASDVRDQPMSDKETLKGALNRVNNASGIVRGADYYVGIEGGLEERKEGIHIFAWVVIKAKDIVGRARTASVFLPPQIITLIRRGKELGEADDIVFKRTNSKQKEGAMGILTGNVLNRLIVYEQAVIFALVSFRNRDLYNK